MFEFTHPLAFLLLPLPLVALWLLPPRRERVAALRVPYFEQIVAATGSDARAGSVVMRRRSLQMGAAFLTWCLLVGGIAKPEWIGEPIERTEAARDVMLAIDLSASMNYRDFPAADNQMTSRFAAVQRVVDGFVAERESDRVGLIVFGTKAYLQLPFTRDLETAGSLVELMSVGMAGPQTALGDAIGLAIRSFEESQVEDRLLILLTDGNDTASTMTPINAADIARRNGVRVFTIGIGDTEATGEDRVDFDTLANIATRTGGAFFNAGDEQALDQVYRRIDESTAVEVRTESWRPRTSLVHWPAGAAIAVVLVAYLFLLLATGPARSTT